jgi:hypothetical protein
MQAGVPVLALYADDVAFDTLAAMMKDPNGAAAADLRYHLELVHLLADCTEVRGHVSQGRR